MNKCNAINTFGKTQVDYSCKQRPLDFPKDMIVYFDVILI